MGWDAPWEIATGDRVEADEAVLVVLVNNLEDWRRVREEHWYRIPLARAPQRFAAHYLAFYHTRVFADRRWTIHSYAPIRRYAVVPRRELLPLEGDHPRADDLYYRIALGPLRELPQPIPSHKLRRVTFIRTTLPRLYRAREINDLWLREPPDAPLQRARRLGEALP